MVSGFDRYYQLARCFRDEDLRADRQPEFTQLDMEMAWMDQDAIMGLVEDMVARVFAEVWCVLWCAVDVRLGGRLSTGGASKQCKQTNIKSYTMLCFFLNHAVLHTNTFAYVQPMATCPHLPNHWLHSLHNHAVCVVNVGQCSMEPRWQVWSSPAHSLACPTVKQWSSTHRTSQIFDMAW